MDTVTRTGDADAQQRLAPSVLQIGFLISRP